ncbi:MAG: bifunctional DNA-formamidopyrimidine glycosylase/DNA-(apurinic or apyrimidinic site) lyase [Planctomycetes bacterium]|nr:bifunctional DNA-formamidopyrimidine glycosylase/DNA-(apurinic or apyrimidinic site) lyase [Planctomycetota bacterium]
MPELPEVETVVRQLAPHLLGRQVAGLAVHTPRIVRCQAIPLAALVGARFAGVRRRGKFIRCDLVFDEPLNSGLGAPPAGAATLLVHLRMTGRLMVLDGDPPRDGHDHIDLRLDDGRLLRFRDVRKFGGWYVLPHDLADGLPPLSQLGPEPLEISKREFADLLGGSRGGIKALLLDQHRLAGLGNIYCDESLFAARIHPETPSCDVPSARVDALWQHMRRILRAAIRRQGSTISDFVRPDGRRGGYQDRFRVYGRSGQPCTTCGRTLQRLIVAGRGTTCCPACQVRPDKKRRRRKRGA